MGQQSKSHQLLQRGQLLWEVAQSCPVELQPSQTAHTLDMFWEVPPLYRQTQDRGGGAHE